MALLLIAHRCGPGVFPEQSIASARHALSIGADMVEMDVQYTSDGYPVICHDPNASRMFGVDKLVKDMTFCEFMTLRQVQDKSYPSHSLQDVLTSGIAPILLHCKITGGQLKDLALRIKAAEFENKTVIGVQEAEDVETIKSIAPHVRVLSFMPRFEQFDSFLESRADYIRLWEDFVNQSRIDRIHSSGKQAWIMAGQPTPESVGYTTPDKLLSWANMQVDGVLVNDIGWAKSILGRT